MNLSKNSSREDILDYIKYTPYDFLCNFSDKVWAQPYLDEAANKVVKKSPFYLLCNFSGEPWAQPYIDEAINKIAKKYPELFLKKLADRFPHHINLALFALGSKNEAK